MISEKEKNMQTYDRKKYLQLLSKEYKNIDEVTEEIINLQAIANLPKGTEVFLSDIHGEYEPFEHILNNGAGIIRNKIDNVLENYTTESERNTLATLIYYPEEKLKLIKKEIKNLDEWYGITLYRLVEVARKVSSKYTRSKVRKATKKGFGYIIDELLHSQGDERDKDRYYKEIIKSIVELNQADQFIIAISDLIKCMAIDHLHIIGDIFDRGRRPDLVMERLMNYHSLDIQWGNHDILWMGAACGNKINIANVIRICARYNNIDLLEDRYGINMRPLSTFAIETYKDDDCLEFLPKVFYYNKYENGNQSNIAKIHKAITIIQFKLEGQMIKKHPEYNMQDRLLLDKIDFENQTIYLNGKTYKLNDNNFPTIDKKDVYKLTDKESELIERLTSSFKNSELLNKHIAFLYTKGSMYTIFNSNLLFHGCVPMTEEGEFKEVEFLGKKLKGKRYFDYINEIANKAYWNREEDEENVDIMWYLWTSKDSPLFGKEKMATFESYFISDKEVKKEKKSPYYKFIENEEFCEKILNEFGLDNEDSHIMNGHMPVKAKDGESPIKANGKLFVIDGGFAKSYREKTGNAGYILTYNSNGLLLSQSKPFESIENAIKDERDIITEIIVKKQEVKRKTVGDTDIGKRLKIEIEDLKELLNAYRAGEIK
ncbi:MAG: fructose-1,6-bisphosphatase [Clostridia bacterium]|nr:fructose-1,6-bisphosphatase [Clostridia bacterium]